MRVDDAVEKIVLAGYLKRYPRLGGLFFGFHETIASHSFRTAYIAYELSLLSGEDPGPHVLEALYHEFYKAKTLDVYVAGKRFVSVSGPDVHPLVKEARILEYLYTVVEEDVSDLHLHLTRMVGLLRGTRILFDQLLEFRSWSAFHRKLRTAERLEPWDRIHLAGLLKKFPRSGWLVVGVNRPERIADHVFRTMVIADLLSQMEGYSREEEVIRAMLHDLPEALTGDLHKLAKLHVQVNEKALWDFIGLENPGSSPVLKDADKLELFATVVELESVGVKGLGRWKEIARSGLKLESSKEIAEALDGLVLGDWYVDFIGKVRR